MTQFKHLTLQIRFALCLGSLLGWAACAAPKETVLPAPRRAVGLDAALIALYAEKQSDAAAVQTLDADAQVLFRTPELNQSLGCVVKAQRAAPKAMPEGGMTLDRKSDGALQIVGAILFGIPVVNALMRPDSVFVHNIFGGQLLVGEASPENLRKATGMTLTFNDLLAAFIGAPEFPSIDSVVSVSKSGASIGYLVSIGGAFEEVMVDSTLRRIESVRFLDAARTTIGLINYRKHEALTVAGKPVSLPQQVEFVAYKTQPDGSVITRQVVVTYNRQDINNADFKIEFTRPASARVRRLEDMQGLF